VDWQVIFYIDEEGNEPVKDFILGQPDGAIAEILHVFKLLRHFNITLGMPYVRKIDKSGIRELELNTVQTSTVFSSLLIRGASLYCYMLF